MFSNVLIMPSKTYPFNPFSNNKILTMIKLKAFAGNKFDMAKITISPLDNAENTVGKGDQHFLFFPQYFPKPSS